MAVHWRHWPMNADWRGSMVNPYWPWTALLRCGRDPAAIWRRMDELCSGGYGFVYLQDGPERWQVQVTRRPAP
jgi:hypothetical protein